MQATWLHEPKMTQTFAETSGEEDETPGEPGYASLWLSEGVISCICMTFVPITETFRHGLKHVHVFDGDLLPPAALLAN